MNFYILINSSIYWMAWNAWLMPQSEVPSLVFGWSLLLFTPLLIISEFSRNAKVDKWLYRSFKSHVYDRLMVSASSGTGVIGVGLCFVFGLFIQGDWIIFCLVGITILNAVGLAGTQFFLYMRLLKTMRDGKAAPPHQ